MSAVCWIFIGSDADVQEANDKSGKPYYKYEILTRTGAASAEQALNWQYHLKSRPSKVVCHSSADLTTIKCIR
jgi:hypothetical protein